MSRYRLTIAVTLMLTASYQLYAQWSESFTRIESQTQRPPEPDHPVSLPETFLEVAQQVLPDVEWLRKPEFAYQSLGNELFIYAGAAEFAQPASADETNPDAAERIRLEPFVLIRRDPKHPAAPPFVIQCETARLQFENPVVIGFDAPNPGRIMAATFDGAVEITGPDGLHLHGENFDFSEESLSLYSARAITFSYGPTDDGPSQVRGSAIGLQVTFSPSADPDLDPGLPRIGGIESVQLLQKVVLDCLYEERDGDDAPQLATAHISCDDALEFNARPRNPDGSVRNPEAILLSNVLVRRPTGGAERPDEADTLRCHQLSLRFVDRKESPDPRHAVTKIAVDAVADNRPEKRLNPALVANPFSGLRVHEAEARGSPQGVRAMLQSDEHRMTARMQLMNFDIDSGTAVLFDEAAAVQVDRDGTQLRCKTIRVSREMESNKPVLTCLGRGQLQHVEPATGALLLEATWARQLHAAPDAATGLMLVQIDEDARLIVQERAGLRADHLNLWIDDQQFIGDAPGAAASPTGTGTQQVDSTSGQMPLRYFEASGGVIMANSEMRAETELLQAVVESGQLPVADAEQAQQAGAEQAAAASQPDPWQLSSQRVSLKLLNAPQTRNVQVAEAVADGEVVITRSPAAAQQSPDAAANPPVSLSGAHLELVNRGGAEQVVKLTGSPVLVRHGAFLLECLDLEFDRAGNRATIVGAGLLQAPVDRDLNGGELEQPMLLDVKWQEGMTFDGGLAAFRKMVVLQLHDSVLQCDEMDVRLDRPIRFTDQRPDVEQVAIRDVSCRNGVRVEIYDWEENKIIGMRKGTLTQFLLDYQSGDFQGDGPGQINHWSRSEGRRLAIAPRKAAQANVPVSSDLDWEHINVEFDDLLLGNFKTRTAELHGRVRMVYAPVRRVSETFSRDDLSGTSPSVEHAVWLGCNMMTIELHSTPKVDGDEDAPSDDYLIIGASGLCELEGQLFHAKADSLSYDESKEQFTLRGKGAHQASIYYQKQPGAEPPRIEAQTIQFFPSLQEVKLQNAGGIQGTP